MTTSFALTKLEKYIEGNGKILFTDYQCKMSLDDISLLKNGNDTVDIYNRFNEMYFC